MTGYALRRKMYMVECWNYHLLIKYRELIYGLEEERIRIIKRRIWKKIWICNECDNGSEIE